LKKEAFTMRLLFTLDAKNYDPAGEVFRRPSVRGIVIRSGKIALVHSLKYDYYKFPGGGVEAGESRREALIREVLEEAGLAVVPASVRAYGSVRRIEKGQQEAIFLQENLYYLCDVECEVRPQALDGYEAEERFTLVWTDPLPAIAANRRGGHGPKSPVMLEREARVLETLIAEGYFG